MDLSIFTFLSGVELASKELLVIAQDNNYDVSSDPHTIYLLRNIDGNWSELNHSGWVSAGISRNSSGTGIISLGPQGQFINFRPDGYEKTPIIEKKPNEKPPTVFRFTKPIGTHQFAGGTNRYIFQMKNGKWQEISNEKIKSGPVPKSFENITGFDENELYAFGWKGVICSNQGNNGWHHIESPTNRILNDGDIHNNTVYIGGQLGTIIKGRGDTWELIKNDKFTEDIWSVCSYNDGIYFSTASAIYQLKDDKLSLFKEVDSEMRTAMNLFTGLSGLWSIGSSDISLFNGEKWISIIQSK